MIKIIPLLWETDAVLGVEVINNTPLWQNPNFKIPIKRDWLNKGINAIVDFLDPMRNVLPVNEFYSIYVGQNKPFGIKHYYFQN